MLVHPRRRLPTSPLKSHLLAMAAFVVAACGPTAGPTAAPSGNGAAQVTGAPKGRVIMALAKEPEQLSPKFGQTSRQVERNWIFDSPLTYYDIHNSVQP